MPEQHFGLYEKALPRSLSLPEKLRTAKELGYDYFELSTDESQEFQDRMTMSREARQEIRRAIWEYDMPIWTMCLSGTRNCPIGSEDEALRAKGIKLTKDAVHFAADIGLRIIQVMAYDDYYGERNERTHALFLDNLKEVTREAASCGVTLALENVDIDTMDSLEKGLDIVHYVDSPYLQIFPDIANVFATGVGNEGACAQYRAAASHIVASHVKDTVIGKFRDVPFGEGDVGFPLFFSTLRDMDFHGPLTLEMWAQNYEDPVKSSGWSLQYIKDMFYKK